MSQFTYTARDARGKLMTGFVTAPDQDSAGNLLCAQGKFVVALTPTAGETATTSKTAAITGVSRADVIYFANQMAVMVATGVPLVDALEGLTRLATNPKFKTALEAVTAQVRGGASLSDAMAAHPKVFPAIMTALIRASEASGTMSAMLDRISRYLARDQQTLKQIRGALMYPIFMLLLCVTITIFLMTFVLPRFAAIYASKGAVLPAPTRILMGISGVLTNHWMVLLGAVVAMAVTAWIWGRSKAGRRHIDWLKLHLPVVRTIYGKFCLSRALRTLGTMIAAGVPLLESIGLVRGVTPNFYYGQLWNDAEEDIGSGRQLSETLFECPLIPNPISQMIQSGERSGRLNQVLERLAEFTESEFEQTVKTSTQFIEPVMIVTMGAIIGFIAIALLLPIFSIGQVMAKG